MRENKVFIDTCSLLAPKGVDAFFGYAVPILERNKLKLIVPLRVVNEVEKHANKTPTLGDPNLPQRAKKAIETLNMLGKAGLIDFRGEESDNFADNVFMTVFAKFRVNHKLLLITQDNNLTEDILRLNESKSVRRERITVARIGKDGFLYERTRKPSRKQRV
jgi:hypothetical protein